MGKWKASPLQPFVCARVGGWARARDFFNAFTHTQDILVLRCFLFALSAIEAEAGRERIDARAGREKRGEGRDPHGPAAVHAHVG